MNDNTRLLLANLGKLNHAMGLATRDLLHEMRPDGHLPAGRLRELARVCDDMGALLDNAADEVDPPGNAVPVVVDVSPEPPAGAADPPSVAPAGPPTRRKIHADIARMRDSARRCSQQGLVEAAQNFLTAAAALVKECGCGKCPGEPRPAAALPQHIASIKDEIPG